MEEHHQAPTGHILDENGTCVECGLHIQQVLTNDYSTLHNPFLKKDKFRPLYYVIREKLAYQSPLDDIEIIDIVNIYTKLTFGNILKTRNRLVYLFIALKIKYPDTPDEDIFKFCKLLLA